MLNRDIEKVRWSLNCKKNHRITKYLRHFIVLLIILLPQHHQNMVQNIHIKNSHGEASYSISMFTMLYYAYLIH